MIRDIEIYEVMTAVTNEEASYLLLADEYELFNKRIQQIVMNMENKIKKNSLFRISINYLSGENITKKMFIKNIKKFTFEKYY